MGIDYKSPKDFLYNRKGPWPQPCPEHPFGESAGVIHLPLREAVDWWLNIGSRYVFTLAYTPVAFIKGILNPGLEKVNDEEFAQMLTHTMLAKFIKNVFDSKDKEIFGDILLQDNIWICDFEPVRVVKTFPGIYASATKTLLKKDGDHYTAIEIYVDETKSMFRPGNGDAWELAKYFVLQGGALCSTLVVHPLLHFPMDSVNAITKTALPKDHIIFQLLFPHLRFTLYLEKAVLTFKSSLLMSKWWMPYAPYPGEYEGLRDLLVEGYNGIDHNYSYPPFKYQFEPEFIVGKYGEFHQAYYPVFRKFVTNILVDLTETEVFYLSKWADYISGWVPGFPKGVELVRDRELLISTVAYYLFDVSIGHTVDHYNYGNMDIRKIPLRLRHAPPKAGEKVKIDRSKLTKFWDYGKYEMARRLFFKESTKTRLMDAEYDFGKRNTLLQKHVKDFKNELRAVDQKLKADKAQFAPIDDIAASIQF
nr:lipoxygenase [Bacteriovorax sp. HI3]